MLFKKMIYSIYYRLGTLIGFHKHMNSLKSTPSDIPIIKYKIGNVKYHNTEIDSLIPQMIEIGDDFISAPGSKILAHDASTYIFVRKHRIEKTVIGDRVFLGANAIIMPGVTVGNDVIIGAGAIVTKNIESGMVVVGSPARVVSTVKDYIKKCQERDVLFDTPKSFEKVFTTGSGVTGEDVLDFQEKYLESIKKNKM